MIYKTTDGGIEYHGTNAERLASFPDPKPEGLIFRETDGNKDTYKIIFGNWTKVATATGGGASAFLDLSDTPSSYSGQANKLIVVNSGETAIEFINLPTHDIITTHTASGLTAGHVLQALTPTTFGFGAITESMISDLDHTDTNAIHVNVAGEINGITEKATPVSGDLIVIEDSADSNNKKKVQIGNLPGGSGSSTFLGLTDTPSSFASTAGQVLITNAAENALIFDDSIVIDPAGLITFSPTTYSYFTTRVGFGTTPVGYAYIDILATTSAIDAQRHSGVNGIFIASPTANTTGSYAGNTFDVRLATNYDIAGTYGVYAITRHQGSGTIGNSYGFAAVPIVTGGGTITKYSGLEILNASVTSGTLTAQYGVYINSLTSGTSNYAIYTGAGTVSLGDNLQFRQVSTISTTTGILTLTGNSGTRINNNLGVNVDPSTSYIFRIGGTTSSGASQVISASITIDTDNYVYGMLFAPTISMGSTNYTKQIFAIEARPTTNTGYSGNVTLTQIGVQSQLYHYGTGNVNSLSLFQANNAYMPNGGTLTQQIGLYVGNLTAATTNYAIYTNTGLIRFGDKVGIGTVPSYQLHFIETSTDATAGNKYMGYGVYTVNPSGTFIGSYYAQYLAGNFTSTGTGTGALGALRLNVTKSGVGTLAVAYGLYVDSITVAASNNYAIWTNAGDIRLMSSATDKLGFHGSTPVAKQTVTGSKAGNAALTSLLTALANLGLIVNSTT